MIDYVFRQPAKIGREGRGERGSASERAAAAASGSTGSNPNSSGNSLAVPRLSVCADVQKVDRSKLAQTEFAVIEFDSETFRLLLDYLHTGSCPLTCNNIPGLICAAEHYDLPELLQACFHHTKQFLRIEVVRLKTCRTFFFIVFNVFLLINRSAVCCASWRITIGGIRAPPSWST